MNSSSFKPECPVCKTNRHIVVADEHTDDQYLWSVKCRKCLRESFREDLRDAIKDFNALSISVDRGKRSETMFIEHAPDMTANIFRLIYYNTCITSDEKRFAWDARERWKFFEGVAETYKKIGAYSNDITALCFESLIGMLGKMSGIHLHGEKGESDDE